MIGIVVPGYLLMGYLIYINWTKKADALEDVANEALEVLNAGVVDEEDGEKMALGKAPAPLPTPITNQSLPKFDTSNFLCDDNSRREGSQPPEQLDDLVPYTSGSSSQGRPAPIAEEGEEPSTWFGSFLSTRSNTEGNVEAQI